MAKKKSLNAYQVLMLVIFIVTVIIVQRIIVRYVGMAASRFFNENPQAIEGIIRMMSSGWLFPVLILALAAVIMTLIFIVQFVFGKTRYESVPEENKRPVYPDAREPVEQAQNKEEKKDLPPPPPIIKESGPFGF